MTDGPCARCVKKLDLRVGDVVWFCMQCPDVMGGGADSHTGYTYWLCSGCYEEHGEKDHDFHFTSSLSELFYGRPFDFPVQHHLGSHKFMSITESEDLKDKREGYREFLDMGVPAKDLQIMDGAFEMLQDKERKEVSAELMAEHLSSSEDKLTDHPSGIAGAMAYCLDVESIAGVWVGRMDFIKLFVRMTAVEQFMDRDELFKQFQLFLGKQPKRVIVLDARLDSSELAGTLVCNGLNGNVVASLAIDETTTVGDVEKQLLSIIGIAGHQLKLVFPHGLQPEGRSQSIIRVLTGKIDAAKSTPDLVAKDEELEDVQISVMDEEGDNDSMNQILKSFKRYDTNGDRLLDRSELKEVLLKLDPPLGRSRPTENELELIMNIFLKEADTNSDGCIDMPEFVRWLWRKPRSAPMSIGALQPPSRVVDQPTQLLRTVT